MLAIIAGFVTLFGVISGAPLSGCDRQAECLDLTVSELGDGQYELCLFFDNSLDECQKGDDAISHACKAGDDNVAEFKVENWVTGDENALCQTVGCGEVVNFGVKDGPTCDTVEHWFVDFGTQNYSEYVHCYDTPMDCSGNPKKVDKGKACRWAVLAPSCNATTTAAPETTPAAPETTEATTEATAEMTTTEATAEATTEATAEATAEATTEATAEMTTTETTVEPTTTTEATETTMPESCIGWTDAWCGGELSADATAELIEMACGLSNDVCCVYNPADQRCLARWPSPGDAVYARITQSSLDTQLVAVTGAGDGNGDGNGNSEIGGASQRVTIYGGLMTLVALVIARFM